MRCPLCDTELVLKITGSYRFSAGDVWDDTVEELDCPTCDWPANERHDDEATGV
jgi:hypothetical protein